MLDNKEKESSSSTIRQLITEKKIVEPEAGREQFFLDKRINSFALAKRILDISENKEESLRSFMWVVSISYYSMFFAATALLAHFGHKIKEEKSIHKLTYHALVYYFLINENKLQKYFLKEYKDMYNNAEELLQFSEQKVESLVHNFDWEREKRRRFTYEMGEVAEVNKARTSLQRAEEFLTEVRKIIQR